MFESISQTDEGGRAEVAIDPLFERIAIQIDARGYEPFQAILATDQPQQVVHLESARKLEGSLMDSEGKPIAIATIKCVGPAAAGGSQAYCSGVTNEQGWFSLTRVPGGDLVLQAFDPERGGAFAFPVAADEEGPLFLVVELGLELRGEVVDSEGTPLEGVRVLLEPAARQLGELPRGSVSDSEGRFLFEGVPEGRSWRLVFGAQGFSPHVEKLALTRDLERRFVLVDRLVEVRLQVVAEATGELQRGQIVRCTWRNRSKSLTVPTDSEGAATLWVEPGSDVLLSLQHETLSGSVAVHAAADGPLDVVLLVR